MFCLFAVRQMLQKINHNLKPRSWKRTIVDGTPSVLNYLWWGSLIQILIKVFTHRADFELLTKNNISFSAVTECRYWCLLIHGAHMALGQLFSTFYSIYIYSLINEMFHTQEFAVYVFGLVPACYFFLLYLTDCSGLCFTFLLCCVSLCSSDFGSFLCLFSTTKICCVPLCCPDVLS